VFSNQHSNPSALQRLREGNYEEQHNHRKIWCLNTPIEVKGDAEGEPLIAPPSVKFYILSEGFGFEIEGVKESWFI